MTTKALFAWHENICVLKLRGSIRFTDCPSIDRFIKAVLKQSSDRNFMLDLTETELLDSTALGMLAQIAIDAREHSIQKPTLIIDSNDMMTLFKSVCFEQVFNIVQPDSKSDDAHFEMIEPENVQQNELSEQVLKAHESLMQLSYGNHLSFQEIMNAIGKQDESVS